MAQRRGGGNNREKKVDYFGKAINSAVQEGIKRIVYEHPIFAGHEDYIASHVDNKKIKAAINRYYQKGIENGEGENEQQLAKVVGDNLYKYIASGQAFDDVGKKIILKYGNDTKIKVNLHPREEKKGLLKKMFSRGQPDQSTTMSLNSAMRAFYDLQTILEGGNYEQSMPEVTQAITTVRNMGFAAPAMAILKENGLIDDKRYKEIEKGIEKITAEGVETVVSGIEKYVLPEKIAAAVLGLFGVGIIVNTRVGIVGAAIGSLSHTTTGIIGGALILLGTLLFVHASRRKKKKS